MAIDVTAILRELLKGNLGTDSLNPGSRVPQNYGVTGSLEGNCLVMELTFRTGSAYCCMEWGCHVGFTSGNRWERLRQALIAKCIDPPHRIELRSTCVVEEGAMFFDLLKPDPARRGCYELRSIAAQQFQVSAIEGVIA